MTKAKFKIFKYQSGFTLVESVLAVGLLGVSSLVSLLIVSNILNSANKGQASIDLEQTANFVLSKLTYDLQESHYVNSQLGGGSTLFIKKKGGEEVFYTVEDCNIQVSPAIKCVRRNGVSLTDHSSDFTYLNMPGKSSVGVRQNGGKPYFNVVYSSLDSGKALGVNLAFEFYKPNFTLSDNFGGSLFVDTTVVLSKP